MREIKFRFWDVEQPDMVSWKEATSDWDTDGYAPNMLDGDHWISMQFTGLQDCNGVDIYEGDIVKSECGCFEGPVQWCSGEDCGWSFYDNHTDDAQYWDIVRSKVTVIGNIHENPELLR